MSSGTWKGVDKPGGARFYAMPSLAHEKDCPKCRYGTLRKRRIEKDTWIWRCIDCNHEIPIENKP